MDALILGLRVAVALGAVLGLIWLLQRRLGKGTGRRRADAALSVVSRQSVGQRASVVVVDAGGRRFLLGVTDHAVNVLHTGDIPEEALEVPVPGAEPRRGGAAAAFAQILAGAGSAAGSALPAVTDDAGSSVQPPANPAVVPGMPAAVPGMPAAVPGLPEPALPRRSSIHRDVHSRGSAAHPLHGSILAGSTWKQAAAALRSGRRN